MVDTRKRAQEIARQRATEPAVPEAVGGRAARTAAAGGLTRGRGGVQAAFPPPEPTDITQDPAAIAGQERDAAFAGFGEAMSAAAGGRLNPVVLPSGTFGEQEDPLHIGTRSFSQTRPGAPRSEFNRLQAEHEQYADLLSAQTMTKAANMGMEAEYLNNVSQNITGEVAPYIQQANEILDSAQRQFNGIQEMMDDVLANRINPGQFFSNLGQAGGFASAMAVAAGTLASALGGGPNVALSIIEGAIQRNMRAQAINQAHDREMLQANIQVFDRMRQMGLDRMNMANVYQAMLTAQAELGLRSLQASSASAELRANAQTVLAELAVQRQQLMIDSFGTIQSSSQMKLYAEQQRMEGANQEALQGLQEAWTNVLQSPEFQSADAAQRQDILRNVFAAANVPFNPQLASQLAAQATAEGTQLAPGALEPVTEDDLAVPVQGGTKYYKMRPQYRNTTEAQQAKIQGMLRGSNNLIDNWQEAGEIINQGVVGGFRGKLSNVISFDEEGMQWKGSSPDAARLAQLFTNIVYNHMLATRGTTEAMQSPNEFLRVHAPAAGVPTDPDAWAAWLTDEGLGKFTAGAMRGALKTAQGNLGMYTYDAPNPDLVEDAYERIRQLP